MRTTGCPGTHSHFGKSWSVAHPRTGNVLSPAAVVIENGKIKEVGSPSNIQAHAPAGAKAIDLGSATLLPGLIDSHTHLLVDPIAPAEVEWARHYNGAFSAGPLAGDCRIAKQTSVDGRAGGSGRSGEWHYDRSKSWSLWH